jgi:hypothetical protein
MLGKFEGATVVFTQGLSCAAVGGHIMDTIVQYYTAWLEAGSPAAGLDVDVGFMVPIARGERVCPPDAPVKTTPIAINSIILMCDEAVTETATKTSRCSYVVIQVCLIFACIDA